MKKTAILLGATGLTGSLLLENLLADADYDKIKVFTRKSLNSSHSKIEEHVVDLLQLENQVDAFTGDVVFCCIGTTKAKTPDKETYKKIDYGIPVNAAKLAALNGIPVFMVMSSIGASPDAGTFYSRTKGEMERDVLDEKVPNIYIFQPSLIVGDRKEKRFWEDFAAGFMKVFDFLIPKKYKPIAAKTIADAMQVVADQGYSRHTIVSEEIKKLAKLKR